MYYTGIYDICGCLKCCSDPVSIFDTRISCRHFGVSTNSELVASGCFVKFENLSISGNICSPCSLILFQTIGVELPELEKLIIRLKLSILTKKYYFFY